MNLEEKSRITQNLSSLKDNLSDLDPLIDRLIEKEVFKLEHRDQIEQMGGHQKQVNEFIKILTSSPNAESYTTFLEALQSEKFYSLVDKIQGTAAFHRSLSVSSSLAYVVEDPRPEIGAAASGITGGTVVNCAGLVRDVLHSFGKRQEEMFFNFEKLQREERREFERRRLEDKREMERSMQEEKLEYERQRKEDKQEHRDQLDSMWKEWQEEKNDILQKNEDMIEKLHRQINEIHQSDMEYKCLREKYSYLKEVQQRMREKDNERVERLREKTKEREELRKENMTLREEVREMMGRLQILKDSKENENWEMECISSEKENIEKALHAKDIENRELKRKVVDQYTTIQGFLEEQRTTCKVDDPVYVRSVEQQMKKVDEVYHVLGNTSEEKHKLKKQVKPRNVNPIIPATYKKPQKPYGWKR